MAHTFDYRFTPFDSHGKLLGKVVSVDGVSATDFGEADVAEILELGNSGNQFDGHVAVILRLNDGRFAAYENAYASYAGTDFSDGNGVVYVAHSTAPLVARLSEFGQRLLAHAPDRFTH